MHDIMIYYNEYNVVCAIKNILPNLHIIISRLRSHQCKLYTYVRLYEYMYILNIRYRYRYRYWDYNFWQ